VLVAVLMLAVVVRGLHDGEDDVSTQVGSFPDLDVADLATLYETGELDEITVTADRYRAARAGELPSGEATSVGNVGLPDGHLVEVDPSVAAVSEDVPARPVAWLSDELIPNVGQLWGDLAAEFPETGLWPLVVNPMVFDAHLWSGPGLDKPSPGELDGIDAEATLAGWWSDNMPATDEVESEGPELAEMLAPFDATFPGLAIPPAGDERAQAVALVPEGYLALIAVERPADAPLVLGWTGPLDHFNDLGPLTVVLRSWEERFGVVVVGVGFDTLTMAVRQPPATADEALAIAAEHYAACPDLVWQGAVDIKTYAATFHSETTRNFWWD
jgi:hypothetical protein